MSLSKGCLFPQAQVMDSAQVVLEPHTQFWRSARPRGLLETSRGKLDSPPGTSLCRMDSLPTTLAPGHAAHQSTGTNAAYLRA